MDDDVRVNFGGPGDDDDGYVDDNDKVNCVE